MRASGRNAAVNKRPTGAHAAPTRLAPLAPFSIHKKSFFFFSFFFSFIFQHPPSLLHRNLYFLLYIFQTTKKKTKFGLLSRSMDDDARRRLIFKKRDGHRSSLKKTRERNSKEVDKQTMRWRTWLFIWRSTGITTTRPRDVGGGPRQRDLIDWCFFFLTFFLTKRTLKNDAIRLDYSLLEAKSERGQPET